MNQLHLIQSPITFQAFESRYALCVDVNDSILFLNDSLFSLAGSEFHSDNFISLMANTPCLCLDEQLDARAIGELVAQKIKPINYPEFVKLSQQASKIVSW